MAQVPLRPENVREVERPRYILKALAFPYFYGWIYALRQRRKEMLPEYEKLEKRSSEERIALIVKWSDWFYANTVTFDGKIGMQLAYLWAAIANASKIEVLDGDPIVALLKEQKVKEDETIWEYIDCIEDEG